MAKGPSFNFGANRKPRKSGKSKGKSSKSKSGSKSNAWRSYTSGSNAPIPP